MGSFYLISLFVGIIFSQFQKVRSAQRHGFMASDTLMVSR